ncbi:hypothetical protein BHM03_00048023, partial [Ensete ventricosum]
SRPRGDACATTRGTHEGARTTEQHKDPIFPPPPLPHPIRYPAVALELFPRYAMTKQNVVPVEAVAAIAVAAVAGSSPLFPYPPPRAYGRRKYLSHLELGGGRIGAWVESMKASSPTHAKATAARPSGDAAVDEQSAWVVSASCISSPVLLVQSLFLSGANDVSAGAASLGVEQVRADHERLQREADRDVHGLRWHTIAHHERGGQGRGEVLPHRDRQRAMPGQGTFPLQLPVLGFTSLSSYVYKALLERTKSTPGARVENNKFCVSVHFRCVDEKVRSVLKEYPKLRLTQGRKVLEIRPTIKWDKGKALEFLLESLGKLRKIPNMCYRFSDCKNVMPVYIGDDRTDEDAFKVKDFLVRLVEWKRLSMKACSKRQSHRDVRLLFFLDLKALQIQAFFPLHEQL